MITGELLWRVRIIRGEISRKFIHIMVGSFIAVWPFYMSFETIQLLSVVLFAVVAASKLLRLFKSIHMVERKTIGELLFPIGVFLAAVIAQSPWVFAAAILHLSLADGLAAVMGTLYIKLKKGAAGYLIFGRVKTVIGTIAFLAVSLAITSWILLISPAEITSYLVPLVIALSICATVVENISGYGTDNITIPLLVVVTLNTIAF